MLMKFYNGMGISTCILLGAAFASGWHMPALESDDNGTPGSSTHYSSGRTWFYSSSGWSFGK